MAGQTEFSITYGELKEKDKGMASSLRQGLRRLTVNGQPGDADLKDTTQITAKYLSDKLHNATDIRGEPKTPEEETYYSQLSQNVGDVANRAKNELENQRNQFRNNQAALGERTPDSIIAQPYPLAQQATNDEIDQVRGMIKTREDQLDADGTDIKVRQKELDGLIVQHKELSLTVALQPSDTVQNIDDLAFIVRFLSQISATALKNAETLRKQRKLDKDINSQTKEITELYRTYNTNYKDLGRLDLRLDELGLQAAREQREAEERANQAAEGQEAGVSSSADTPDSGANPTPSGADLSHSTTLGNQESADAEAAARMAATANAGSNPTNPAQSNTNNPDSDAESSTDLSEDSDNTHHAQLSDDDADLDDVVDFDNNNTNEARFDEQNLSAVQDASTSPTETNPDAINPAASPTPAPRRDNDVDHGEEQSLNDKADQSVASSSTEAGPATVTPPPSPTPAPNPNQVQLGLTAGRGPALTPPHDALTSAAGQARAARADRGEIFPLDATTTPAARPPESTHHAEQNTVASETPGMTSRG